VVVTVSSMELARPSSTKPSTARAVNMLRRRIVGTERGYWHPARPTRGPSVPVC
jgi:hypothetical protein